MARTAITAVKLTKDTISAMPTNAAVNSGSLEAEYTWAKPDAKILIILENSSADIAYDVTIEGGNAEVYGALTATNRDYTVEIAAATTKCISVNSAKFVNTSGTDKGKIIIKGENAAIKVGVIELP